MRCSWLAALCLLANPFTPGSASGPAHAYTVDDMLALQAYGQAQFDPAGRWAVIDRYRRYDSGAHYRYDAFTDRALGQVMRIDLSRARPLAPLFPQGDGAGYWIGSLSPHGQRLSVFRLMGDHLSLGIVDMRCGKVAWLAINPATPLINPVPAWIDDSHLLVLEAVAPGLSFPLDMGNRLQQRLPALWASTDAGHRPGATMLSSKPDSGPSLHSDRRLVLLDLDRRTRRVLATGAFVDLALSPDHAYAALSVETGNVRPAPGILVRASDLNRRHTIRVLKLDDGTAHQLCRDCDTIANLLDWSPDGTHLLYFARQPGEDWEAGALFVYDPVLDRSIKVQPAGTRAWLPDDDSGARLVRAGWMGGTPLLYAADEKGSPHWLAATGSAASPPVPGDLPCEPARLFAAPGALLVPCATRVWAVRADGERTLVLEGDAVSLARAESGSFDIGIRARYRGVVPAGRATFLHRTGSRLEATAIGPSPALDLARGERPALPGATSRLLGMSPDRRAALAIDETAAGVGRLWLTLGRGAPVMIDRINKHLDHVTLPVAERLEHGGGGLVDWLILPAGVPTGSRLPMIVLPYPGTVFDGDRPAPLAPARVSSAVNPLLLAGLGYAVLLPSLPDARSGDPARDLAALVLAATDRATASGRIDPDRIAVYGHSFGGFAALAVATQTRRFAAYIASAAAPDLTLQHGFLLPYDRVELEDGFPLGPSFGWAETGQGHLGAAPWADPVRYQRNSPYYQAGNVHDPVLLIQGDLDPVTVTGPERMFADLYRQGQDVALLRYWGEGHVVRSPANIRDMWRQIATWLAERLKPSAGPRRSRP